MTWQDRVRLLNSIQDVSMAIYRHSGFVSWILNASGGYEIRNGTVCVIYA
jgi:hypothetical protein